MKNKFVMTLCVMLGLICGIGFTGIVQYKACYSRSFRAAIFVIIELTNRG